jgi:hypothetical protein
MAGLNCWFGDSDEVLGNLDLLRVEACKKEGGKERKVEAWK